MCGYHYLIKLRLAVALLPSKVFFLQKEVFPTNNNVWFCRSYRSHRIVVRLSWQDFQQRNSARRYNSSALNFNQQYATAWRNSHYCQKTWSSHLLTLFMLLLRLLWWVLQLNLHAVQRFNDGMRWHLADIDHLLFSSTFGISVVVVVLWLFGILHTTRIIERTTTTTCVSVSRCLLLVIFSPGQH